MSPTILGSGGKCCTVSFYYNMYGTDIASMEAYLVDDTGTNENPVAQVNGEQGRFWQFISFNVSSPIDFKVGGSISCVQCSDTRDGVSDVLVLCRVIQ